MTDIIDEIEIIESLPMTKGEIIALINETIQMDKWTVSDLADGREIDIFPEWMSLIEKIAWDYRWAGWEVFHYIHGDRQYLSFTNPYKRKFNGRR